MRNDGENRKLLHRTFSVCSKGFGETTKKLKDGSWRIDAEFPVVKIHGS